ncbi:MAG: polysulfide reductase NrfD [Chloroflexi bacterium]|nr:polysulfide reductase NrfD [Chloroflexota bacterium]
MALDLPALMERLWSDWRGKPKVKGLADAKFILDYQVQRHWDWRVAFYLFGAGTSAGLIFLEVLLRWLDVLEKTTALVGMWIGLTLALLSLVALFDHLGPRARWRFWYAIRNPRTSWISRGFFIVAVLVLLRIVVLLPSVPGLGGLPWGEDTVGGNVLRAVVLLFALGFMAYSGLVLSSWAAIAFWNTPMLPVLYMGYSFLGGMAALPLIALVTGGSAEVETLGGTLWPWVLGLLLGNGLALLLYVWGMATGIRPARVSVRLMVRGPQRWNFWVGVAVLGLVLPIVIVALEVGGVMGSDAVANVLLVIASAGTLVGGYILREAVLKVGVYGPPV